MSGEVGAKAFHKAGAKRASTSPQVFTNTAIKAVVDSHTSPVLPPTIGARGARSSCRAEVARPARSQSMVWVGYKQFPPVIDCI